MKRRALSKPKLQHMRIMKGKHDEIFVFIFCLPTQINLPAWAYEIMVPLDNQIGSVLVRFIG